LLDANRDALPGPGASARWRWPEPRLAYGNALIVEAHLEIAALERDRDALDTTLELLDWLVHHERRGGSQFSFTPVGGGGPDDGPRRFDQQPIEAWTLASACERAHAISGDQSWRVVCQQVARWFDGANDTGVAMWDVRTGAGYDGLTPTGVNTNQGAESTLALIGTMAAIEATAQAALATSRSSSR
jgi:hypothetical protein